MQILRIQYTRVPKIRMLNHRFRPDSNHLVVTLDVNGYDPPTSNGFLTMYYALADLFPTLKHHSCCEEWENTPLYLQEIRGVSIKSVGEPADVAHLVEHVIVDLQCNVSGMRLCSGITCGHSTPENRFDLFVECMDPRVGVFAANFATYLVTSVLSKQRLSHRYGAIAQAARLLQDRPELATDAIALAHHLDTCPTFAHWCLSALVAFGFIEPQEACDRDDSQNAG